MTEFGLALVIGGLGFAVSMIPVVAYTLNFGCRKKRPAAPTDNLEYLFTTNRFRNCFMRDLGFAMISLLLFFIALESGTITVCFVCLQLSLFIMYVVVVWYQDKKSKEQEKLAKGFDNE